MSTAKLPQSPSHRYALLMLGVALTVSTSAANAQWPDRPITVVVPYAAGGGVDNIARIVMPPLAKELGQTIVISNKPGANANIGSSFVASAPPDGYTFLVGATFLAANRALMTGLNYDSLTDLAPVSRLGQSPALLVTSARLPIHSVKELVEYGNSHPTETSYASVGVAALNPLIFVRNTGIKAVPVLYKGGGQALPDLISGRVTFMLTPISEVLPTVESGSLRALAVTGVDRPKSIASVPTMAEQGVADLTSVIWWGVFSPKGMPEAINVQMATALDKVLRKPEVIKSLSALSIEAAPLSGARFADFYRSEIEFYADTAKAFDLKPD